MEPEIDYLEKLALQLAGLAQIRDWVGGAAGWPFWLSLALLAAAALATLAALVFLAQSIWPARFRYVTSELELHTYLETVRTTAAASGSSADQPPKLPCWRLGRSWCSSMRSAPPATV